MKTLELKQMEKLNGGDAALCAWAISMGVVVGVAGALTGGLGWIIGGAGAAAAINEGCNDDEYTITNLLN